MTFAHPHEPEATLHINGMAVNLRVLEKILEMLNHYGELHIVGAERGRNSVFSLAAEFVKLAGLEPGERQ